VSLASAIYEGPVHHLRVRPRRHALRHHIFQLLVDLDEGPALGRACRLFGWNRPALLSLLERDHGDGSATPLKDQLRARLRDAGLAADGPIRLLCMPRVLGHVFNPLSIYFCHAADGSLAAVLYEVNNTFGERHAYLLPASPRPQVEHSCFKRLHVSPFMDMGLTYAFRITPPDDRVSIAIQARDADGLWLAASFAGARRPFRDGELLRVWLRHPLLCLGVLAAIHWQALRLLSKGVRFRSKPAPPASSLSVTLSSAMRR
jgi:DUF1365 family protein